MNTTDDHDPAAPPTIWPSFAYADAPGAIRFLTEVLGFTATVVVPHGDDETRIAHAELWWPEGGGVMLGSRGRDDSEFSRLANGGCYVVTDDVDAVHARAIAAGAEIVRALEETDYGSRQFVVADPEGVHWCFGTYRGHRHPVPG